MSKSRSFSIYLLKDGYDATNALKDDHGMEVGADATGLLEDATLFVLDNAPREPWWKGYFGVSKPLRQVTKGALVFLPVGKRCFALSFGHVFHYLKDTSYEYDFGLRVTLNSLDPNKLKSTDVLEPGAARRQRTQMPVDSDLTYFDFDRDATILKSLTGKVKEEYKELFKHATGAANLRISTAVAANELVGLCETLLELYASEDYRTTFPDIQNIEPVRDPVVVDALNSKLLAAFREKDENLYLAVPDIVDYRDNVCATFAGAGRGLVYDDVFMGRYYDYLERREVALNDVDIEVLKRHALILTDEDGNARDRHSIMKCMIYDTTLAGGTDVYHVNEGSWYKVETEYADKLAAYLDPLCADLTLPDYNHKGEGAYNKAVAAGDTSYVCLDMTSIGPPGQTAVEPCDLYSVDGEVSVFHHVKVSTFSSQLSHLFNQGTNAIELLKLEPESDKKLRNLINGKVAAADFKGFTAPLDDQKFRVVFAIVTHKDKTAFSANLPLFSRISLMRITKALKLMSVDRQYGFVKDVSPKSAGKKKAKKKKAGGAGS
jgi:uncharacterized protein (TIGR04141 family)